MSDNAKPASGCTVEGLVRCPVCQRGDIWQEAVSNTLYVYSGEPVKDGKEVVDYLLASVAAMLESALEIRGSCPGKERMNNEKTDGGATVPCISLLADALAFYATPSNWRTPSTGFAAQYDPEPSPIERDGGQRARIALQANDSNEAR